MALLTIIVVLLVVGLVIFLINRYAPIDGDVKNIIKWVIIVITLIWLLKALGVFSYLGSVHV